MFLNIFPLNAANNPRNTYEGKPGDTLREVASTYGATLKDLELINGLQTDLCYF
jgi:LysM repeat protein